MHVALLTPSLKMGGYERVVVNYANELHRRGHAVTVVASLESGELEPSLSPEVRVHVLGARARSLLRPLTRFLRDARPDVLYSGFRSYNALAVAARRLARSDATIIASQHGFEYQRPPVGFLLGRLIAHADVVTANTADVAAHEARALSIEPSRIVLLANPVVSTLETHGNRIGGRSPDPSKPLRIVAAGRLAAGKRMDLALQILASIMRDRPATLTILGDGPERDALERAAERARVTEHVRFEGSVGDPVAHMRRADVFLHTAEVEAFGNVLVEALEADLPIVTTSCSGPLHIIRDNEFGVAIGSVDDAAVVERGARAIMDIADGKVAFHRQQVRAHDFTITRATEQLLSAIDASRAGAC